jgi:hypothetical protein
MEPSPSKNEDAIMVRLEALGEKLDAVHLSVVHDIGEVKGKLDEHSARISSSELKLARLQGAGMALTFGLPFIVLALQHAIH